MKNNQLTLVIILLITILCTSCNKKETIELTFSAGPDDTKSLEHLIEKFNYQNKGSIHVTWKEASRLSDEFFAELYADLNSEQSSIDVFASDVVWTGVLGAEELTEDLSRRFYNEYDGRSFMQAAMNSAIYNFRVYGVPWYTDASMIFYRKDLLRKHGFDSPPQTWDELKSIASTITAKEGIPYGYVFQGDKYEGGVTNACEFIWNAGGQITMDNLSITGSFDDNYIAPSIITVDSKVSENGFKIARSLIVDGISPQAVTTFRELETTNAFLEGKAVFMRGWPGIYGQFLGNKNGVNASQVGVSPIPVLEAGSPSYSCLGGWNLMINAQVDDTKKEAAWQFIQYLTAAPQQRYRALNSGVLPTLKSLYTDQELLEKMPVISLANQKIQNAKSRPVSPHYMKYSPEIAIIFNQMLKGESLPEYAVFSLQEYLEKIQLQHSVAENN